MTTENLWRAPDLVPTVTFEDLPRAIEWLGRVLGFRERSDARLTWPGGGMTWFEVGDSLLRISTPREQWGEARGGVREGGSADSDRSDTSNASDESSPDAVMKVYVDDVDLHFSRAKAEGARIVSEPEDGFWGGRIYRLLDPEGHAWEVGQRDRDLAAAQWRLPPGVRRGVGG